MRHAAAATILFIATATQPLAAQRAQRPFPRVEATSLVHWTSPVPASAAAKFGHPDDYRWEGVLVGAVGGGVLGALFGYGFCEEQGQPGDPCLLSGVWLGLAGAAAAGVVGGLIGGLIPKAPHDSAP